MSSLEEQLDNLRSDINGEGLQLRRRVGCVAWWWPTHQHGLDGYRLVSGLDACVIQ